MQNKCCSPLMKRRLDTGTGDAITRSPMEFSDRSSNVPATLATKTVPSSLAPTFAEELSRRTHPALTPFAFAAMSQKSEGKPSAVAVEGLLKLMQNGSQPDQQRFALRILLDGGSKGIADKVAEKLIEMAKDPSAARARFALRAANQISEKHRSALIASASAHPNGEIQKFAKLLK